jgi:hypothetical protein
MVVAANAHNLVIVFPYCLFQENENKFQMVEKYFKMNEKRESND